ncbi:hypothetical protein SOASR029_01740 [Budvicia aquatica]|nr:hypothetical protein SOASR029_01740 [Budvicia aquatica]
MMISNRAIIPAGNKGIITKGLIMAYRILTVILLFISLSSHAENWELEMDKEGIRVFLSTPQDSSFKAYRAETIIKALPGAIASILADMSLSCQLMYGCKQARLIKQQGYDYWAYSQIKAAWPVSDRDLSIYSHAELEEDGTIVVKVSALPENVPAAKDHIRITKLDGFWKFIPIDSQTTQVIYQVAAEPGGSVPAWLANKFVVDGPFETLKAFRQHAEAIK